VRLTVKAQSYEHCQEGKTGGRGGGDWKWMGRKGRRREEEKGSYIIIII